MNEIKIYRSTWKSVRNLLLVLPFAGIAIWDLVSHQLHIPIIINGLAICLFGTGAVLSIYNILDCRPQIIINETGIYDRSAYKDYINWNIIEHAYWRVAYKQPFVCIIVKDDFKHLIKGNAKLKAASLAMGFEEININLSNISSVDEQALTGFIIALSNAKPADRGSMLTKLIAT